VKRLRHRLWRRARVAELRRKGRPISRTEFVELLALTAPRTRIWTPFEYRRQKARRP
jgi:hypothetical protein